MVPNKFCMILKIFCCFGSNLKITSEKLMLAGVRLTFCLNHSLVYTNSQLIEPQRSLQEETHMLKEHKQAAKLNVPAARSVRDQILLCRVRALTEFLTHLN